MEVGGGHRGEVCVLAEEEEERVDVVPEKRDGEGGRKEKQDGAVKGEPEEMVAAGSEGLATDGFHAHGESGENRVPCDVGEADGQRAASERQVTELAKEEHGDYGTAIEEEAGQNHRQREAKYGLRLHEG